MEPLCDWGSGPEYISSPPSLSSILCQNKHTSPDGPHQGKERVYPSTPLAQGSSTQSPKSLPTSLDSWLGCFWGRNWAEVGWGREPMRLGLHLLSSDLPSPLWSVFPPASARPTGHAVTGVFSQMHRPGPVFLSPFAFGQTLKTPHNDLFL